MARATSAMEERSADPILQGRGGSSGKSTGLIKVVVQPGQHRFKLKIWSSTLEVKQMMRDINPVPVSWMRLLHNNVELINSQRLIDLVPTHFQGADGAEFGVVFLLACIHLAHAHLLAQGATPLTAPPRRVPPNHEPNRSHAQRKMYPGAWSLTSARSRPCAGAKSKRL